MRWLSFVPIAVMGTLVAGEVFRPQGEFAPPLTGPHLWASAITAAIYWRSRSFLGATLSGMIAFVALRALLS
jgi:branched-subunit amino acid transport protein